MSAAPDTPAKAALPVAFATLQVATANLLNLALPGRVFYPNQDAYTDADYRRKIDWIGERLRTLNADVLAVQEVWDEAALRDAVAASGLHYAHVRVPGAENTPVPGGAPGAAPDPQGRGGAQGTPPEQMERGGAQGTPRVGLISRLPPLTLRSLVDFPPACAVDVPEIGVQRRFERPPLLASLRTRAGQTLHVIVVHLKSKRPKFLQDDRGNALEDRDDPQVQARATLRSLIMRGAEAAALRATVVELLRGTRDPLVVMGDFNDDPQAVTTQLVAATAEVAYDRQARDTALFNAYELQGAPLKKDVAFSHIHQGSPAVLDQILVSEEFHRSSRFAVGDVQRVDYFNDHLFEGRDRSRSDHGFVRAVLRWRLPERSADATRSS